MCCTSHVVRVRAGTIAPDPLKGQCAARSVLPERSEVVSPALAAPPAVEGLQSETQNPERRPTRSTVQSGGGTKSVLKTLVSLVGAHAISD